MLYRVPVNAREVATLPINADGTPFLQCELSNGGLVENAGRDSSRTKHETRIGEGVRSHLFCFRFRLSLCASGRQLCSLAHRIQIQLKYGLAHRELGLGPECHADLRTCIRIRACKSNMRYFRQEYAWMWLTDPMVPETAWRMGFEFGEARSPKLDSCSPGRNDSLLDSTLSTPTHQAACLDLLSLEAETNKQRTEMRVIANESPEL